MDLTKIGALREGWDVKVAALLGLGILCLIDPNHPLIWGSALFGAAQSLIQLAEPRITLGLLLTYLLVLGLLVIPAAALGAWATSTPFWLWYFIGLWNLVLEQGDQRSGLDNYQYNW